MFPASYDVWQVFHFLDVFWQHLAMTVIQLVASPEASDLSDDGTHTQQRYLEHLLRWWGPRWIYPRRRDSRRISWCPAALVPRRRPCLSQFTATCQKCDKNGTFWLNEPAAASETPSVRTWGCSRTAVVAALNTRVHTPGPKIVQSLRWLHWVVVHH